MEKPGDRLRTARMARSLSQQQLADSAGITVRTIRSVENGRVRPQQHSLRAIAAALGFTAIQTRQFLALWAPAGAQQGPIAPVTGRALDVDAYLGGRGRPLNADTHVVSATNHAFVGRQRQIARMTQDLLLESRRGPVHDHWLLWGDDPDCDITATVTAGGSVAEFLNVSEHRLLALRIALTPALRPDSVHRLHVHWEMPLREDVLDPEAVDEFAMGWRDVPHLTTVAVTFTEELPSQLWTAQGANPRALRNDSPIEVDPTGTASITDHADDPGMLGIRWRWS